MAGAGTLVAAGTGAAVAISNRTDPSAGPYGAPGGIAVTEAVVPAVSPGPVDTDWTRLPAGPMPPTDSAGRAFRQVRIPAWLPTAVVGGPHGPGLHGRLPDDHSASYVVQDLGRPVTAIGATFSFGPGTREGSLCLACFVRGYGPGDFSLLRTRCHFVVSPHDWKLGVFIHGGFELVAENSFAETLPQDGTPLRTRVVTRRTSAVLDLPDGTTQVVDDPRVKFDYRQSAACWEFFRDAGEGAEATLLRSWAQ